MSSDLQIAFNPESTYRRLVAEAGGASWLRVLTRLAFLTLTFAVIVPILATHVVTLGLVLVSAAAWLFVPLVQAAMALVTIAPARGRAIGLARAFELWFAGHFPYTIWILLMPAIIRLGWLLHVDLVLVTFAAAIAWASVIETAYCRTVLNESRPGALARVTAHQALMLALVGVGVLWAAGGVPGITGFLARTAGRLFS